MKEPTYKELHEWLEHAIWREDELKDKVKKLEKALDEAKKRLMQIAYLNMSDHGIGSDGMMIDWCKTVACHALKEIESIIKGEHNVEQ